MSNKDKKARRMALRRFLVETPGAIDRVTDSLGWLVVLGALALGALALHLVFGRPDHPPPPPPGGPGDNPSAALYARDLGRLPDGRHTFDLVYSLILRNATERPFTIVSSGQRLALGDAAPDGDVVALRPAPATFSDHANDGRWQVVHADASGRQPEPLLPGHWRAFSAHYRIIARVEQFADVAIHYGLHQPRGWFDRPGDTEEEAHDEEVQLGAVVRVHCPLGVKIENGEMKSLCGS